MDNPRKSVEDSESLRGELARIVRTVADRPDLEVTSEMDDFARLEMVRRGQNPDEVWFFSPGKVDPRTGRKRAEYVRIPEKILEGGEIPAKGKAAHEGAHVASTRFDKLNEAEIPRETGFQAILHALEERPTDMLVRFRHPEAGQWLDTARIDSYLDGLEQVGGAGKKLSRPKLSQLCNLFVYGRFADDPENYDPEVLKIYEELQSSVEFIESCVPEKGATEKEILRMQGVRFRVIKNKIWPRVQEILHEDFDEQTLQALIQAILDGQIQIGPPDGQAPGGKAICKIELPPELAAQLAKLSSGTPPSDSDDLPTIKASPELIKALQKSLDSIPEEVKKQLEEKAAKAMEKLEQKLVDQNAGKLVERPKTPLERRQELEKNLEKAKQEAEEKKIQEQIQSERAQVQRDQAALLAQKSKYDQIYDEVRPLEQAMYKELEDIFHPKIKAKVRMKTSGAKVNLAAYIKWETQRMVGKLKPIKFFESTEMPQKKNFAITLLVDLSGSMRGEKIHQTMRAIVAISEAFNRLGLHFEILGFQDDVIVFKKFSERLDEAVRMKISGMEDEVSGENPGGHNQPSYNDDGPCLLEAAEGLAKQPGSDKFLIVLSDGVPEGRRSSSADLTSAVETIQSKGKVNMVALGLGSGTEHVSNYYPTSLPNISAHDLPDVLPALLEDIMENPRKYRIGR